MKFFSPQLFSNLSNFKDNTNSASVTTKNFLMETVYWKQKGLWRRMTRYLQFKGWMVGQLERHFLRIQGFVEVYRESNGAGGYLVLGCVRGILTVTTLKINSYLDWLTGANVEKLWWRKKYITIYSESQMVRCSYFLTLQTVKRSLVSIGKKGNHDG